MFIYVCLIFCENPAHVDETVGSENEKILWKSNPSLAKIDKNMSKTRQDPGRP